ncbi:hypothetical protein FMM56_00810 [Campylobacter sp. LR264d]|uniref:hypothetical protein n=1 Tax=Campylobacter sp. LR264d TaxID=2593544 RepID=UPI00123999DE|nr:hypothetical protein [Campylobacter sp. LR264d]KAA6234415.1 hypothetical protein FMM56_00810 [Campylobacter sp. LR264d]
MKKIFIIAFLLVNFSYSFSWGTQFLTPVQYYKNYLNCLNTAKNGTAKQKILAQQFCLENYGVDTNP